MMYLRHGICIGCGNPGAAMSGNSEEVFSNYLIELRSAVPNNKPRNTPELVITEVLLWMGYHPISHQFEQPGQVPLQRP